MTFEEYKKSFNIILNDQQEKAVRAVNGNILLLAVPGSGKTTVLVSRLGYMIYACGIAPENILTMTYTVAAANDMKKRFISMFGDEYAYRLIFKTINAVCYNIIRYYSKSKGTIPFEIVEESERSALLSRIFKEINNNWPTELQKRTLSTDITFIKNMMFKPEEILECKGEGYSNLPKIFDRYNSELRKMKKMDYDDQLIYAYSIFMKYPEILNTFRSRYKYICIDEAQDTSKIQHEIIRLLADSNDGTGNYFAVGDEDQSIYGFRAAYPEALYDFEKTYPNAQVLLMERNYRSTRAIVASADMFIKKNANRHPKSMIADSDEEGEPIEFVAFKYLDDQYDTLVNIAKYCEMQTAVLFHDNDSSIPIIDKLNRENIGYRARGLDSAFFSNPVVLDIVAIMQFAIGNCTDREFFDKNYYKFGLYIKKDQSEAILKSCPKGKNIIQFISDNKNNKFPKWMSENALDALEYCRLIKGYSGGAATAFGAVVYGLGYKSYLENLGKSTAALNILSVIAEEEPSAKRFISRLDELKDIVAKGGTDAGSKFTLSTVHSSKGLEYDKVIIIDAYDGSFPKADKLELPDEYEEERRLFYVAMTRAKKKLVLYRYSSENCTFQKEVLSDIRKINRETASCDSNVSTTLKSKSAFISPDIRLGDINNALEDRLHPGTVLNHNMFGRGTVKERVNDKIVSIYFDQGIKKDLAVEILLRNRLIEYLDE